MIGIDEAYQHLARTHASLPARQSSDRLTTEAAIGRILAHPIDCHFDHPLFSQSAMDGIAFRHDPAIKSYQNVGTVAAGDPPDQLQPKDGECVRIMTGAPIPATADTVEMVEYLQIDEAAGTITLNRPVTRGSHIRVRGENFKAGDVLYERGMRITPAVLAGLLAQGTRFVEAVRPVTVGVAATGNEIVDYRQPLGPGQIYNTNGPSIAAMLARPETEVSQLGVFADDLEHTAACLQRQTDLDLIVLSGGVSMGTFDMVPKAAELAGFRQVFHKIRMKPGKPIWFGVHESGSLLFGLPGNPVSAMVGTLLYVEPMIQALVTGRFEAPRWVGAPLAEPWHNRGRLTLFTGVQLENERGRVCVRPIKTSGSGDLPRFSRFETLARIGPTTELTTGEEIQILLPFTK